MKGLEGHEKSFRLAQSEQWSDATLHL